MPAAVVEAKEYLFPLQVRWGVKYGADTAGHEVQSFIYKYGHDSNYILLWQTLRTYSTARAERICCSRPRSTPHISLGFPMRCTPKASHT